MDRRVESIISVIAIILLIVAVTTSIGAFLERNFLVLIIDFIAVIVGVILLALAYGK
jgi:hypothetical protein